MIYRDAEHAIARIMSIEAIDGTQKADWQRRYEAGYQEEPRAANPCPLSASERLAQDAMTRAMIHRELKPEQWNALVARYSINDREVVQAVQWLAPRAATPAHHLFRMKCVTAWAIPPKRGAKDGVKTSRNGLPDAFYELHTWDNDGTPEGTLRRWKSITRRWLEDLVTEGIKAAMPLLKEDQLLFDEAA